MPVDDLTIARFEKALRVRAREPWNDTGLDVPQGTHCRIVASEGAVWTDLLKTCDADGYPSFLYMHQLECKRRVPKAPWFALIATFGKVDAPAVVVGRELSFEAPATGRLYLFANDIRHFYWNNFGSIEVRIRIG